jgi:hypothetical protein
MKELVEIIIELNKGTTEFNKYFTSQNPKIDFPQFVVEFIKKTIIRQKNNKYENSGHPKQNNRYQDNRFNKFGYQQQQQFQYAPMMNQMPMGAYQQPPFMGYPPQGLPMQQNFPQMQGHNGYVQNQYRTPFVGQNANMTPGIKPPGYYPVPTVSQVPVNFATLNDLKVNRQAFEALGAEVKAGIYKQLIIKRLNDFPEYVKQYFN